MKKRPITASELVVKLETDVEYMKKRLAKDETVARLSELCSKDQKELVAEIRKLGYNIDSVWDFVNNSPHQFLPRRFTGSYPSAYPVLLKHLRLPHHPKVREGIIRALTVNDGGLQVEEALLVEFQHEQDPQMKWVLANALKTAMTDSKRRKLPEIAEVFKGIKHNKVDSPDQKAVR